MNFLNGLANFVGSIIGDEEESQRPKEDEKRPPTRNPFMKPDGYASRLSVTHSYQPPPLRNSTRQVLSQNSKPMEVERSPPAKIQSQPSREVTQNLQHQNLSLRSISEFQGINPESLKRPNPPIPISVPSQVMGVLLITQDGSLYQLPPDALTSALIPKVAPQDRTTTIVNQSIEKVTKKIRTTKYSFRSMIDDDSIEKIEEPKKVSKTDKSTSPEKPFAPEVRNGTSKNLIIKDLVEPSEDTSNSIFQTIQTTNKLPPIPPHSPSKHQPAKQTNRQPQSQVEPSRSETLKSCMKRNANSKGSDYQNSKEKKILGFNIPGKPEISFEVSQKIEEVNNKKDESIPIQQQPESKTGASFITLRQPEKNSPKVVSAVNSNQQQPAVQPPLQSAVQVAVQPVVVPPQQFSQVSVPEKPATSSFFTLNKPLGNSTIAPPPTSVSQPASFGIKKKNIDDDPFFGPSSKISTQKVEEKKEGNKPPQFSMTSAVSQPQQNSFFGPKTEKPIVPVENNVPTKENQLNSKTKAENAPTSTFFTKNQPQPNTSNHSNFFGKREDPGKSPEKDSDRKGFRFGKSPAKASSFFGENRNDDKKESNRGGGFFGRGRETQDDRRTGGFFNERREDSRLEQARNNNNDRDPAKESGFFRRNENDDRNRRDEGRGGSTFFRDRRDDSRNEHEGGRGSSFFGGGGNRNDSQRDNRSGGSFFREEPRGDDNQNRGSFFGTGTNLSNNPFLPRNHSSTSNRNNGNNGGGNSILSRNVYR